MFQKGQVVRFRYWSMMPGNDEFQGTVIDIDEREKFLFVDIGNQVVDVDYRDVLEVLDNVVELSIN